MALILIKGHLPDRGPFSNGCKVPLQGPHRFRICGINPQLGIISELRHLAGEVEVQVIDINDKMRGPKTVPCGTPLLTAVQSEGTPLTMTLCLLHGQPILYPGSNIALDVQGSNLPHEPFVRDFIEGFAEVQKDCIHGPRTVTLTEHVLVKVKDVCNTRPTLTETVLARVYEVVCFFQEVDYPVLDNGLKDFSWDGSKADGSVIPRVCEETLFGDGANVRRPKVLGHLCRGQRSVKDLTEVRDHATHNSLEDFGQEAVRASCLVRLQLLQLRLDLRFGTVDVC